MGRSKYFTLMELLLTIAILAMVGSLFLFRAKPMIEHYRFSNAMSRLKREILYTKRLSETASADITFLLWQEGDSVKFKRVTDEPLNIPQTFDIPIDLGTLSIEGKAKIKTTFTASGAILWDHTFTLTNGSDDEEVSVHTLISVNPRTN